MKYLLACFAFFALSAHAQSNTTSLPSYGVYTSSANFQSGIITNGFTAEDSRHKLKDEVTHKVSIINGNNNATYNYDSIWGFRRDGSDWRIFDGHIYKVVYTGKAYVYIRPTKTDFSAPGLTRFETTFFSATPDSPVYPLTKQNLLLAYSNNAAFVSKVRALPPSFPATKKDKSTGLYQFISWLP